MPDSGEPYPFIQSQHAVIETLEERVKRYLSTFELTEEQRTSIMQHLSVDANLGRVAHANKGEKGGDLCMLDTCVNGGPTGDERGVFYAVDFGGTNIRCVRVELLGNGRYTQDQLSKCLKEIPTRNELPRGLMDKNATATELFDVIAELVLEVMRRHADDASGRVYRVGFTFSFAITQLAIDRAEALSMSKGFETGSATNDPVVHPGTDIVLLLNKAFLRKSVPAEVVAVLNDTTGTLISGAYLRPPDYPETLIGVILGTGMNVCYVDPEAHAYGYVGSVINTEAGALKRGLPFNVIDHEVDDAAPPLGRQLCEKMVSGLYLGEIARRAILKVFQHRAPPLAWAHFAVTTEAVMLAAYDADPARPLMRELMEVQLEWPAADLTNDTLEIAQKLCRAVCRRSAQIMSCIVGELARKTGRLQPALGGLTVVVDGSVYVKNKTYQEDFREGLQLCLGEELSDLIKVSVAIDGSGLGAAILAASPQISTDQRGFAPSHRQLLEQRSRELLN